MREDGYYWCRLKKETIASDSYWKDEWIILFWNSRDRYWVSKSLNIIINDSGLFIDGDLSEIDERKIERLIT